MDQLKKHLTSGQIAETIAAQHLESSGHKILFRNWKTPKAEIDIISTHKKKIYFSEVKYRENDTAGAGLEYVTKDKVAQMIKAYKIYTNEESTELQPVLQAIEVSGLNYEITEVVEIII